MTEAYSLGSINVDAAKELFTFLAQVYPFVDETAKDEFTAKVNALDTAGNPNEDDSAGTDVAEVAPDGTQTETAEDETSSDNAANATTEAETPATPEGTTTLGKVTANEAPTMTPNEEIASLEAQLADAKARASQTPTEAS